MQKAVILDMDRTLIASADLHAGAWQDAFSDFGYEVAFGDIRRQIGKDGDQLMPVFLSKEELETKGEGLEKHRGQVLKECYLPQVTPFPIVRELLQRIQADGTKVALASSAKEDELEVYKEAANIEDLLEAETSSDDAESSKPNPDIFLVALKHLGGMPPDQAIVIGDTPYDTEAAGKAGLRTIGLLCGGWSEADFRKAGCITTHKDPADLLAQYDTSPLAPSPAWPATSPEST